MPWPNDSSVEGTPSYFGLTVAITDATSQDYRIALAEQDVIQPGPIYTYYVTRKGTERLLIRPSDDNKERLYRRLTVRELKREPW